MVLIDVHGQVDIDRFIILYSQSDIHRDAVNRGAGRRAGVQSGRGAGRGWPRPHPSSPGSTLARWVVTRGLFAGIGGGHTSLTRERS